MNLELYLEKASYVATIIGFLISLVAYFITKKRIRSKTINSIYDVVNTAKTDINMIGITFNQILENQDIVQALKHKVIQGVRVRVILANEDVIGDWLKTSLNFPSETIQDVILKHKKSVQLLQESGVELRLIDRIGTATYVVSDNDAMAYKTNYTESKRHPQSMFVAGDSSTIREYLNMFEDKWESSQRL